MDGRQDQLIGAEYPEGCDRQQHERERADLAGRDGENVADQVFIEFGKAPAAHRGDEDAEGDCCGRKDADDRVRRLARPAAHEREQQRERHRQPDSPPDRQRRAAEHADGDACEAGMAERVGEKAHLARDDHRGQQAEERRHDDDGEQHALKLAAGERADALVNQALAVDARETFGHFFAHRARWAQESRALEDAAGEKVHDADRVGGVKRGALRDVADAELFLAAIGGVERDLALVFPLAEDGADERGFARAVRSNEGDHLAAVHVQIDIVQRGLAAKFDR